jgi:hypothetical protein
MTEPQQVPESFFVTTDITGPEPMAESVLDDLRPRYGRALARHAQGERVRFELSMFPLPTQEMDSEGNHQLVAMVVLYADIRSSADPRDAITATRVMQPSGQTDEVIDHHARELLEGMRTARSRELEARERDAKAAMERGEAPPVGGLITVNGQGPSFDDIERSMQGYARGE